MEWGITYALPIAAAMIAYIFSRAKCHYDFINVEEPRSPFDDGRTLTDPAVECDNLPMVLKLVPPEQEISEIREILAMQREFRNRIGIRSRYMNYSNGV